MSTEREKTDTGDISTRIDTAMDFNRLIRGQKPYSGNRREWMIRALNAIEDNRIKPVMTCTDVLARILRSYQVDTRHPDYRKCLRALHDLVDAGIIDNLHVTETNTQVWWSRKRLTVANVNDIPF